MKKKWLIYIILVTFLSAGLPQAVSAAQPITVYLDGAQIQFDTQPVIEDGRVLVPLRAIFEALGANVYWNKTTSTITANRNYETIVRLTIGQSTAYRNNTAVELDVPARIVDGRTLVPLRFVSEAFGAGVVWDDRSRTVNISQGTGEYTKVMNAEYSREGSISLFTIPGLVLVDEEGGPLYETKYLASTKYLIRFDGSGLNINMEQIFVNDDTVKKISISSDKYTGLVTVVIESETRLYFAQNAANADTDFEMIISKSAITDCMIIRVSDDEQPYEEEAQDDQAPSVRTIGEQAALLAQEYIGVRYLWGGTTPDGFDCSGLMVYVYKQFGIYLPRIAADQAQSGTPVSMGALLPGDLVFFYTDDSRPGYVSHVGMYIGNGEFIHSSTNGVTISSLFNSWYTSRYHGARRYWDS